MISDSKMYPWFAFNDYLCFRIDIQGSGDSEGVRFLTRSRVFTDEEVDVLDREGVPAGGQAA